MPSLKTWKLIILSNIFFASLVYSFILLSDTAKAASRGFCSSWNL
jgi:hypothetical protein